jgi:hypothetical protein
MVPPFRFQPPCDKTNTIRDVLFTGLHSVTQLLTPAIFLTTCFRRGRERLRLHMFRHYLATGVARIRLCARWRSLPNSRGQISPDDLALLVPPRNHFGIAGQTDRVGGP